MSTTSRPDARLTAAAVASLAFLAFFAIGGSHPDAQLLVDLTVSGLVVGAIFSLSAMGIVTTYRATGVFNLAHGALAILVTYALWQVVRWGVPTAVAAPLVLLIGGPALGVAIDRSVFRRLQQRSASVAERLVATVGLFVLAVGLVFTVWGPDTHADPVRLFPSTPLRCGGNPCELPVGGLTLTVGLDQLAVIGVVLLLGAGLWALLHRSRLGLEMRAVVDDRRAAELSGVDADRVSRVAWAIGAGMAGLTGVLLAPITFGLDPFRLTLLVTETLAVAVLARLVSLPLAVGGGFFLGLLTTYGGLFSFARPAELLGASDGLAGTIGAVGDPILSSLSVFVLFGALLLNRHLGSSSLDDTAGFVRRMAAGATAWSPPRWLVGAAVAAVALVPLVLDAGDIGSAQTALALGVVFLSIVAVTGSTGDITLGQAGFAGLGAFLFARLHAGTVAGFPALPVIPATLLAALACIPVGVAVAWPAVRRRGLFVALTTLAFGLILQRYVFENFFFTAADALRVDRPTPLGIDLSGDTAFFWFELVVVIAAAALVRNIRRGRLGRVLAALRDSGPGAAACGIPVRRYRLFAFGVSSFLGGLGGALLAQSGRAFASDGFIAMNSLIWFAVVIVAGAWSITGALVAAGAFTMLDVVLPVNGLAIFVTGLAAVALGRMPGGIAANLSRFRIRPPREAFEAARRPAPRQRPLVPSPLARQLLARRTTS